MRRWYNLARDGRRQLTLRGGPAPKEWSLRCKNSVLPCATAVAAARRSRSVSSRPTRFSVARSAVFVRQPFDGRAVPLIQNPSVLAAAWSMPPTPNVAGRAHSAGVSSIPIRYASRRSTGTPTTALAPWRTGSAGRAPIESEQRSASGQVTPFLGPSLGASSCGRRPVRRAARLAGGFRPLTLTTVSRSASAGCVARATRAGTGQSRKRSNVTGRELAIRRGSVPAGVS